MKQIILILALVVGSTSFAQQKLEKQSTTSEKSEVVNGNKIKNITEELDLSINQQETLKHLQKKYDETAIEYKGQAVEIESKKEKLTTEFEAILTPEQLSKFEEMQKMGSLKAN